MVAVALLDPRPVRRAPPREPCAGHLPPGARAVAGLTGSGCRWPLGEVAEEAFGFCGAPRSGGSYCPAHRRLAYAGCGR